MINTRDIAIQQLNQEYEKAIQNINETTDLRVLNSFLKRIQSLNNPRCAGSGFKK